MPIVRSAREAWASGLLLVALTGCSLLPLPSEPVLPGERAARLRALQAGAEAGNSLAAAQLAVLYYEGAGGMPRDPARAHALFEVAVAEGCPASELYLGLMHLSGEHGERDLDAAGERFRRAASQGRVAVLERLGLVHLDEIPLRIRVAYEWIFDPLGSVPEPTQPADGH